MTIAYEVIGAPFVNGSSHLMVTKSLVMMLVVGAAGLDGLIAVSSVTILEKAP
jgi:hypothetical protein